MHSTSEEFYKFLSKNIIEYLTNNNYVGGERFNIYLEQTGAVEKLYRSIRSEYSASIDDFSYKHKEGDKTYKTYSVSANEAQLLVVASSEQVTENFITTIRNQIAKQEGDFKNKDVLILFSGKLDSLLGGSESLLKEGMPLHHKSFRGKVINSIEESKNLKKSEKEILKILVDRISAGTGVDSSSIFDFEFVLGVVNKGSIDDSDYPLLGVFPHAEIHTMENKNIRLNVVENYEIFEKVEHAFTHGDPEKDLDRLLSDKGIEELRKSENRKEVDYSKIRKWIEERKSTAPISFVGIPSNEHSEGLEIWEKADGYSSAQKRKRNVVIFNPLNIFPFEVAFRFDRPIRKDPLKTGNEDNLELTASGHRVKAVFNDGKIDRWIRYTEKESGKYIDLKIVILPFPSYLIEKYKKRFIINKGKRIQLSIGEDNKLCFNADALEENIKDIESGNSYALKRDSKLVLNINTESDEEKIDFELDYNAIQIPFSIIAERPHLEPISGLKVWKRKREQNQHFEFESTGEEQSTIKLITENQEYTVFGDFRDKLKWEHQIIQSTGVAWVINENNGLTESEIKIPQQLEKAYSAYKNYFQSNSILPSLTPINEELKELAKNYIEAFLNAIEGIEESSIINEDADLLKLGTLSEELHSMNVYLSPLHPLVVGYQLELENKIGAEELYDAILKRLTPINLLPFLRWQNRHIYTPIENSFSPEWITYVNKTEQKKGISKEFVRKLIQSKLVEFTKHFSYLFANNNSPITINAFNLGDCKEVLQGCFDFYVYLIRTKKLKALESLPPIDLNIYGSEQIVTKFEELAFYATAKEVKEKSNLDLKLKDTRNWDADDLLNIFRQKVHFYTRSSNASNTIEYAHVSFFNFDQSQITFSSNVMNDVSTGLVLDGLLSDTSSEYNGESYRTGFGTKFTKTNKSVLEQLSISYNSLAQVAFTDHLYKADEALCTAINFNIKSSLDRIYDKSQWVTFIEPKVGLDFFKEKENIVIIHYSDQYNNASGYDAITVTKKTKQYEYIIKEFLEDKKVPVQETSTLNIINLFNAVNGDWLLKLIAQNNQFPREKISILSGIKALLALYYHPEVIWIPVSLEEVLRVSGNVGLNQSEGMLSAKNLETSGSLSDDILMIGIQKVEGRLKMYLYPVEVKIGENNSGVIKKAKEQGAKTANLLKSLFTLKDGDNLNHFKVDLYKNFFAKLALINADKIHLYRIWFENKTNWDIILNDYRKDLLNNEFDVASNLDSLIGEYGIVSFGANEFKRKVQLEDNGLIISLLEQDGYDFLVQGISKLREDLTIKASSINNELLLINKLLTEKKIENNESGDSKSRSIIDLKETTNNVNLSSDIKSDSNEDEKSSRPIEILFGHNVNNNEEVKWYPSTTSKVLHTNTGIIGTMGTGKTQFTKSMVSQLVWEAKNNVDGQNIGMLIFDYKGDYVGDDFIKATNAKVFDLFHLPYNPLAIDVHENSLPLLPLHTASTIKETISKAYGLGKKQEQALKTAIMDAYEAKGIYKNNKESWTKAAPTISDVCEIFMSDEKVAQDSLYAAMDSLQDFEIFEPDSSKTKSLFELLEGVLVINLSGYDESVQNLVVAITLDLFYSQMQKNGHSKIKGDYRQLNKMILVDEADNFLSKNFNSIRKILKEGREFGVGTILSTQFLSHFSTSDNDYSTYILTWIVHRVNEIRQKEVDSLFKLSSKDAVAELMNEIKSLDKHYSIVNLAGSDPLFIKDKAFWELMSDITVKNE